MNSILPRTEVPSGLLHESPNGWLWQIFADFDTGRMLVIRSHPDGSYLPDWHTSLEAYDQYRAQNPQHQLPRLRNPAVEGEPASSSAESEGADNAADSSHAGTGNQRWTIEGIDPDYRLPAGSPVPFDSVAVLADPIDATKKVEGSGSAVYREGDQSKGVIGAVGAAESDGAPPEQAVITLLEGNPRVLTDGRPTVENGSLALIQSARTGPTGALAQVHTEMDQIRWELERYSGPDAERNLRTDIQSASELLVQSNRLADAAQHDLYKHLSNRKSLPFHGRFFNIGDAAREYNRQTQVLRARAASADAGVAFQQARQLRLSDNLASIAGQSGPSMSGELSGSQRHIARLIAQQQEWEAKMDLRRGGLIGGVLHEAGMPIELAEAVNNMVGAGGGKRPSTQRGPQGVHYERVLIRGRTPWLDSRMNGRVWRGTNGRTVSPNDVPTELKIREVVEKGRTLEEVSLL